jgi:ferrochelatase
VENPFGRYMRAMRKIALVLTNLGGPSDQEAVKPFLFNLFNDPCIIRLPQPFRWLLARLISSRRAPLAREIYAKLGGGSPLLPNTEAQAKALEEALSDTIEGAEVKSFVHMRYWHPMAEETAAAVKSWGATEIFLMPLYPQWSTTTTNSSWIVWRRAAEKLGISQLPQYRLCCWPELPGLAGGYAALVRPALERAAAYGVPRLLISFHGLPEKVVAAGDPYQWQCERSAEALVKALALPGLDSVICYQSRVGPLEWIKPATDDEIRRAGAEKRPVVVVPLAFVSDHSETLVELGIEYRHLAESCGVPHYENVPAIGCEPGFVSGLADEIRARLAGLPGQAALGGGRLCPGSCAGCCFSAPP